MWDPVWEKVFKSQAWGRYPGEDLIRFIARHFYSRPDRAQVRCLEVGFGPGPNLWYLAREGFAASGIEGSAAAAALARERLDLECPGWNAAPKQAALQVGDMLRLPWEHDSFDALIDSEAVYCNDFEDSRRIYAEMYRVAKPGARLFVRTFARGSWGDGVGQAVGRDRYVVQDGPLGGKGPSRFTAEEDLPELLGRWRIEHVGLNVRGGGADATQPAIREWIVDACKDDTGPPQVSSTPAGDGLGSARPWGHS